MKLNRRMSALLLHAGVPVPFGDSLTPELSPVPAIEIVGEYVLLKKHYEANKHVSPEGLQDKTGYECFINHVHFPFDGTGDSLKSCLRYAVALQHGLAQIAKNRGFQVIVSVSEHECTVRFHKLRQGESWIAEDLEGYADEAILLLGTDLTTASAPSTE